MGTALAGAPLRPPFSILASMHGGSAGSRREGRGKWFVAGRAPALWPQDVWTRTVPEPSNALPARLEAETASLPPS